VVIHTDAPTAATDDQLADLTQIGAGVGTTNGYAHNGEDIQNDSTRSGAIITMTATDVVWTAASGNLGNSTTGRYFSIFDDTAAGDELMCSYDYGATFTVGLGDTMTVDFGASLVTIT
jgi:hypothetical protein